jgi:hypothetical protein
MMVRWPQHLAFAALLVMLADAPAAVAQGSSSPPAARATAAEPAQPTPAVPPPPVASPRPTEWQTVAGPDRSFTADLPASPSYTAAQVRTGSGSLYMLHQYLLEMGEVAYIVQTGVYPDDINVSNPRINLQGGLDNLAKGMEGGRWASVDWVTHQGLTAADAVGLKNGRAIRSFAVMKGRQVFTLIYAGAPGTARSADVNRFIGSLRVGP